ncbi:hypothetical protein EHS25_000682 [Saitozyma podzolica]|uniref:Uncharacterized protein n=1 Tax=Saitozyma podzolica TaxID=1890683 RepID=A0A427YWT0_9TREE|nr:hypothetical protein EHS25_000682 [Saitozyma podzolica]
MAEHGLKDPVGQGIASTETAEAAFQVFKHYITAILPYRPLLTTRSRLPTHPFLRSACLFSASRCAPQVTLFTPTQIRNLEKNLCQNLLAYQRGCRPSLESVFAGLVLSLLPYGQLAGEVSSSDFDPARMVGMSYGQIRELGHSVFIERMVDMLESDMAVEHITEALDNARLQLCIMARTTWTSVSRCPSNDFPTPLNRTHRRFIELLSQRGAICDIDRHLKFEHLCLDILMNQSEAWRKLDRVATPSAKELRNGNQATTAGVTELDALRKRAKKEAGDLTSLPWLLCQISYAKWWIATRNVWFSHRIATPLVVKEVCDEWGVGSSLAAQASNDMVAQCLEEGWDLRTFPKAIGTALVLCYHSLSKGKEHLRYHFPDQPLPEWLDGYDRLQAIQAVLKDSCPALQHMLLRAQVTLDEYKRQLDLQSRFYMADLVDTSHSAPPFSFDFSVDFGLEGVRLEAMDSGSNSRGQSNGILPPWDPFTELGGGWDWQQTTTLWDRSVL